MYRLLILLLILIFCLKSDAQVGERPECDFGNFQKDAQGCISIQAFFAANTCLIPEGTCFSSPYTLADELGHVVDGDHISKRCKHKDTPEYIEKYGKYEPFSSQSTEERKKIIAILDSSALALLKNSSLSNIDIVLFDKQGEFSSDFQKEAESYLLDKGVKKGQFKIKVINKVGR
jgi:hypothetical protein